MARQKASVPTRMPPNLPPSAVQGGAGVSGMGVSMVDALSTLKIMGLHEEFKE